jgi:hypothetical protein
MLFTGFRFANFLVKLILSKILYKAQNLGKSKKHGKISKVRKPLLFKILSLGLPLFVF